MKKISNTLVLCAIFLITSPLLFAQTQEVWDLEKCLEYAREHNITIQRLAVTKDQSEVDLLAANLSRLPSINFSTSVGRNYGRTIDPTTNVFSTEGITFQRYSIDAGLPIYNAGRINNSVKQSKNDLKASENNLQFGELEQLNLVSEAYLLVLIAEEQLQVAINSRGLTESQLEQTDKLIQAGTLPENDRLDILAQLARDEQAVVNAQNNLDNRLLSMKALLNLPVDFEFSLKKPKIEIPEDFNPSVYSVMRVYQNATQASPEVKASEFRMESAELGVSIARSSMYPTVSVFANLNTNFSDAAREVTGTVPQTVSDEVIINGTPVTFETVQQFPIFDDTPYFNQLENNFGQGFGVSLRVPIFNNYSFKANVERAKLNSINTRLNHQQLLQSYQNDALLLVSNIRANKAQYEAAVQARDAAEAAFENAEKRFQLGVINTIEFTTARNALAQAELQVIQAKYNYLYQIKTLEWTMGDYTKPIRFF